MDFMGSIVDDIFLNYGYILIVIAFFYSLFAQFRVNSTFKKYSRTTNKSGMTGAEVAEMVLRQNGVHNVRVERVSGNLTDHYDPRTNVIRLSDGVYSATTVAAAGVAAHEAGHAVQYARGYLPVKLRGAIIPVTNIASRLATPLLILGFFLDISGLVWLGIFAFSFSVLFQIITLPCEFNASRRAMNAIEDSGRFTREDQYGAGKTLKAAAMTYVAAMAVSLLYLLRYVALANGRRRR